MADAEFWLTPDDLPVERIQRNYGLTPTQARVARLLCIRRTNREIAAILDMSVHTVRGHVEQVLLKLGISNRLEVERRFQSMYG